MTPVPDSNMNCGVKRALVCGILFIMMLPVAYSQADTVIARYKRYLFQSDQPVDVARLIASYDTLRQWADIDYADTQLANWQVLQHLQRTRAIALAWACPRSPYYHHASCWKVINASLDYWLKKRPHNANWWHNQIGVPQCMRDVIVLLCDTLAKDRLTGALQVFDQYRLQKNGEGANLIWSADLGLHYGLLTGNDTLVKRCLELISNEIRFTTGDGIQPDYSFRQHGARLQMFQYGRAFLLDNIRIAWQLNGTAWAYPTEKVVMLVNCILKGWQWMARGLNTVPGTIDRSVSRAGALRSADIRQWIPYLCDLYPAKTRDFLAIARRQQGSGGSLKGFRYFPYADFSVYQQPSFSFFIKTISDRTLATESINSENLKGKLLNSGDAYLVRNGNEYFDLMPCWDWELLPGITGFRGADNILRHPFTGSVGDGKAGLTAMDYCLRGKSGQHIAAKKIWACYSGVVVCLIAGLQKNDITDTVFTVLNQCRWQGNVSVDVQKNFLAEGEHVLQHVKWIYHDSTGYIFLQPAEASVLLKTVTGTWSSVNASGPREPVTEKTFTPLMIHGFEPAKNATGFVLAPGVTIAQVQRLAQRPVWNVLRNDTTCQAVRFSDGTIMAAFFSAGSLLSANTKISAGKPCLVMIKGNHLYVSNPSQQAEDISIRVNGRNHTARLPEHGFTIEVTMK